MVIKNSSQQSEIKGEIVKIFLALPHLGAFPVFSVEKELGIVKVESIEKKSMGCLLLDGWMVHVLQDRVEFDGFEIFLSMGFFFLPGQRANVVQITHILLAGVQKRLHL